MKKIILVLSFLFMIIAIAGGIWFSKHNKEIKYDTNKQIKEKEFGFPYDEHENEFIFYGKEGSFQILKKMENNDNYISYVFSSSKKDKNKDDSSSNYDVTKIENVGEYKIDQFNQLANVNNLTTNGEWELALMEKGASDFVGGKIHGDQFDESVIVKVDDEVVDLSKISHFPGSNIEIEITSKLYSDSQVNDEDSLLADVHRKYVFNSDNSLTIEQNITFKKNTVMNKSYLAMMPAIRKNNGEQITDTLIVNSVKRDVGEDNFSSIPENYTEQNSAILTGNELETSIEVSIKEKNPDLPTVFHISNDPAYNKLYFGFNPDEYEVYVGDVWSQKTEYRISINK